MVGGCGAIGLNWHFLAFMMSRSCVLWLLVAGWGGLSPLAGVSAASAQIVPIGDAGTVVLPGSPDQALIQGGTQAGGNLFHQFQQFGLTTGQTATFAISPSVGNIFSRVTGGNASVINGLLQVTGGNANLFLINPAGVIFGKDARLDLPGSFTATTAQALEFSGQQWLSVNGANQYGDLTGNVTGYAWLNNAPNAVVNAGALQVKPGQQVMLSGGTVINTGTIAAPGGMVTIAAVPGEKLIRVTQDNQVLSLDLPIATKTELATTPINPTQLPQLLAGRAVAEATGLTVVNGEVQLRSGQNPIPLQSHQAIVAGQITAPQIDVTGNRIDLQAANLDANQANGGGAIRVGGDFQGQGDLPKAQQVKVDGASQLAADRGKIIVWSDNSTQFAGLATAPGGSVETSGKQTLDVAGARVKARDWLLDPSDITIANVGTDVITGGTFDPAVPSTIAPGTIEAALDGGTNVTITTAGGVGGNGDITLLNSINQTGGGIASLTLTGRRFDRDPAAQINLTSTGDLTFNLNQVATEAVAPTSSIQNAVDAIGTVAGLRQINLGVGTYRGASGGTLVTIDKDVTINGGDQATTVIRGSNNARNVLIAAGTTATIQNLSIVDGFTPTGESGAGILNEGRLTLNAVDVRNNQAGLDGGGIDSSTATSSLLITGDSAVVNNRAGVDGGGLFLGGNSQILQGYIGNNQAGNLGGGIYNLGSLNLANIGIEQNQASSGAGIANVGTNSRLTLGSFGLNNNTATGNGGGLFNQQGTVSLSDGLITQNISGNNGGGIWSNGPIDLNRVGVEGNQAGAFGGGLLVNLTTANLQFMSFRNNRAVSGGGIYNSGGTATIRNAQIVQNQALSNAGGGISDNGGTLNIFDTVITDNQSLIGGGIEATNSRLSLKNVRVENNRSVESGGGIELTSVTQALIEDSQIVGNRTTGTGYGGGLGSYQSVVTIRDTTVSGNQSAANGGGLEGYGSDFVLERVNLTDNFALSGGGIFTRPSSVLFQGSIAILGGKILNNQAQSSGGGIYNQASNLSISGSEFSGNRAINFSGGAISSIDSDVQISGSTIAANQAVNGGGIEQIRGRLNLTGTTVENNQTTGSGGGIELTFVPTMIQDSRILNNRAIGNGGGLGSYQSPITIARTEIGGNTANLLGGGIEGVESDLTLNDVRLTNNQAQSGGGLSNRSITGIANTTISNSQIIGNQATETGGGLGFLGNTNTQIQGTTIAQNTAGIDGGGIFGSSVLGISNSTLTQNQAARNGGAINANGVVNLANVTIANNTADVNGLGGGVLVQPSGVVQLNNTIVANNRNPIGPDVSGAFVDQGNNLIGSSDGSTGFATSTLVGTSAAPIDPLLGPLANYGGLTETLALLPGSRAIDAGNSNLTTDQRGIARVGVADIGAFESRGLTLVGTGGGQTAEINTAFANPLQVTVASAFGEPVNGGQVLFAVPTIGASVVLSSNPTSVTIGAGMAQLSLTANPIAGSYNVNASVNGALPIAFALTNELPPLLPVPPVPPPAEPPAPAATGPLVLPQLPVESTGRSVTAVTAVADLPSALATIDESFSQDYVQQFGAAVATQKVTPTQVQGLLGDLDAKRGIRSAVIYAMFVPEAFAPQTMDGLDALSSSIPSLLRATERRDSDRLELIFITADGKLKRRSTNYRRSQVEEQTNYFWLASNDVENPASFQQFGQQMQQWLFAPIAPEIQAAKINGLMYVLDQGLRSLPLASMQTPKDLLIQDYTISVVPSLGMLDRQQTILKNQTTLAMGASKFDQLVPLPAVPQELAMIQQQGFPGRTFLNEQFTLANLMQQQRQTRPGILHLATHADFNAGQPQNSFIQFNDQRLTLDNIDRLGLRNSNLELLILSACNTATGDPAAELGFTGMASLFGVRTAIGSLWAVSDLGTLAFMSEFYGRLAQTPSRADALRQTQLAMQQGQVRLVGGQLVTSQRTVALPRELAQVADTTFTHPYYWSGFTMVGNPW